MWFRRWARARNFAVLGPAPARGRDLTTWHPRCTRSGPMPGRAMLAVETIDDGSASQSQSHSANSRWARRFGEYDVLAPLARGGMGGVYLAAHVRTGERVALKVLDPQFANHREIVDRLHAEYAVSARASHPGLVAIRAARVSTDGAPY